MVGGNVRDSDKIFNLRWNAHTSARCTAYLIRNRIRGAKARANAAQRGVAWVDAQSLKRIGLSNIEARMLIRRVDATSGDEL